MKNLGKIIRRNLGIVIALAINLAFAGGLIYLVSQNQKQETNTINAKIETKPYQPKNIHEICWNVIDTNKDGSYDELVTPHRNSLYGTKGPIYKKGGLDPLGKGEKALEAAKELIQYKNDFSKIAGSDKTFYWQCRVDDFNKDGIADKISWPRRNNMPVYETPFSKEIQEKADKVIELESYIFDYIQNNKYK